MEKRSCPPFDERLIEKLMKEALIEAKKAQDEGEVPVGAILVTDEAEIISRGHNSPIALNDPTAHAEILALRRAGDVLRNYRLLNTYLFVTLEPCIMCAGALIWARVRGLFFGAHDKRQGAFGSVIDVNEIKGLNHRIKVMGGILEDEAARILREFFLKKR